MAPSPYPYTKARITDRPSRHLYARSLILVFGLLIVGLLSNCRSPEDTHSVLFQELIENEEHSFRANRLGLSLDSVKILEKEPPRHEDLLGLAYSFDLSEDGQLIVEYYADNLKVGGQTNSVISVVNNLILENELRASALYEELQRYLRQRFGPAEGRYGEEQWRGSLPGITFETRLQLNGQGLTLNFIRLNNPGSP